MRNRLICLIVITALVGVFVSVFAFGVVASAEVIIEDTSSTIEAGTYTFNDALTSNVDNVVVNLPFLIPSYTSDRGTTLSYTCGDGGTYVPTGDYGTIALQAVNNTIGVYFIGGTISVSAEGETVSLPVDEYVEYHGSQVPGFGLYTFTYSNNTYHYDTDFGSCSQTITVTEDTTYTDSEGIAFATWFAENTTLDTPTPSTLTVESGYYSLREPYINLDASWIGESGQSVYYSVPCSVVNGFNNYVECEGFGIEYLGDGTNYTTLYYVNKSGLRYNWFQLVTTRDSQGYFTTSLQMLGIDDALTGTKIYFPSSFEMDEQGNLQMFSAFESSSPPAYEGNVFVDLMQHVIEALDVKVFGYFSPLDVVKGIAGLMLGLWLLKLLAGG